jgi:D-alanine-D-alanine ligase
VKIALVHDDVAARAAALPDERGVLDAVAAVGEALSAGGHDVVCVPVDHPRSDWLDALRRARPALVFNLCEGAGGTSAGEAHVASCIELLGVPVTGSGAETLSFARRKDRVNAVLAASGLPVPAWCVVRDPTVAPRGWTDYPAIVKPAAEDASVGITQRSVARDATELAAALGAARAHAPLLVQRFVGGRELNVGILGEEVLPISEIDFGTMPASHWRIVSYSAKWETDSAEDLGSQPRCPAALDESVAERARCLALGAWRAVDGRGYGRVDLRADDAGRLHVLEVNPNADLAPAAGLARMAAAAGYDYTTLIARIVTEATQ